MGGRAVSRRARKWGCREGMARGRRLCACRAEPGPKLPARTRRGRRGRRHGRSRVAGQCEHGVDLLVCPLEGGFGGLDGGPYGARIALGSAEAVGGVADRSEIGPAGGGGIGEVDGYAVGVVGVAQRDEAGRAREQLAGVLQDGMGRSGGHRDLAAVGGGKAGRPLAGSGRPGGDRDAGSPPFAVEPGWCLGVIGFGERECRAAGPCRPGSR